MKYEYTTITIPATYDRDAYLGALNTMGEDGWAVVDMYRFDHFTYVTMMREKR